MPSTPLKALCTPDGGQSIWAMGNSNITGSPPINASIAVYSGNGGATWQQLNMVRARAAGECARPARALRCRACSPGGAACVAAPTRGAPLPHPLSPFLASPPMGRNCTAWM